MTREELETLARDCGFDHWGFFPAAGLQFRQEVREMCAADKCNMYGKSWSCPPACGTLEEMRAAAAGYEMGLLLQTTASLEDDFDVETMLSAGEAQKDRMDAISKALRGRADCLVMSAGTCTRCAACTYPEAPCRFPEEMVSSMEACGLVVSEVCELASVPYYYGPRTITYSGCVLLR